MDKSQVRTLQEIRLIDAVFVNLVSDRESPVKRISQSLIERSGAEKVGELYSPYFHDCVTSSSSGLCCLPVLEFYASDRLTPNILVLTGEQNISPDDVYAHYEVAEAALNYAVSQGCKVYASCSVFRSRRAEDNIYVAATTSKEAEALAAKIGGKHFSLGRIVSHMGPLLGMAKIRGYRVVSILGPHRSHQDEGLTSALLDSFLDALDLKWA